MKQEFSSRNFSKDEINELFEYDIFDRNDKHIGNVDGLWTDDSGKPAFVGLKTTWMFGKTHVAPLSDAKIDGEAGHIYLGAEEEKIKNAPAFDTGAELTDNQIQEIYSYYGLRPQRAAIPPRQEPAIGTQGLRERSEAPRAEESATMQLNEEQLRVGKREVEAGAVHLRKVIKTERVQKPVELKREDVVIERVPAEQAQASGRPFEGEEREIPLRREEPVIEKEARVREAVRAQKRTETERREVEADVRKEDVEILQGQNRGEERLRETREELRRHPDKDRE